MSQKSEAIWKKSIETNIKSPAIIILTKFIIIIIIVINLFKIGDKNKFKII